MICVNSVRVTPGSVTLQAGKWYYGARAEVCPLNASCRSVRWWSENPNVASVNASSGYIYARAAGTVTIWATAIDGSGCRDCMTVLVKSAIPVESVELVPGSLSMETGSSYLLSAVVCPVNATKKSVTWCSSNTGVATVSSSGRVTAVSKGSAIITATANDGSGKCGCCQVAVTGDVLVKSITVDEGFIELAETQSVYLHCTVCPTNATNQTILWESEDEEIATVNENSGLVHARKKGYVRVYAKAQDGSGVTGSCGVLVQPWISVESVKLCPPKTIVGIGEKKYIYASFCPGNVTNRDVNWSFSDPNKVLFQKGVDGGAFVTGDYPGVTNVTVTTLDGGHKANAVVKVDNREKVYVKRDGGEFINIQFADGPLWKSIGCDIDELENKHDLNLPGFIEEYYDELFPCEKRYLYNYEETYTPKQLALIYLFDPLGLTYFMNHNQIKLDENQDVVYNHLRLKDQVYSEIFGVWPEAFLLSNDYKRIPINTFGKSRQDYYTDAEILFGFHTILNEEVLGKAILGLISDILGMVETFATDIRVKNIAKYIKKGVDIARSLFFSSSILNSLSDKAVSYLEDYLKNSLKPTALMKWWDALFSTLDNYVSNMTEFLQVTNPQDIKIYEKLNAQNQYRVIFEKSGREWEIENILDICPEV